MLGGSLCGSSGGGQPARVHRAGAGTRVHAAAFGMARAGPVLSTLEAVG